MYGIGWPNGKLNKTTDRRAAEICFNASARDHAVTLLEFDPSRDIDKSVRIIALSLLCKDRRETVAYTGDWQ